MSVQVQAGTASSSTAVVVVEALVPSQNGAAGSAQRPLRVKSSSWGSKIMRKFSSSSRRRSSDDSTASNTSQDLNGSLSSMNTSGKPIRVPTTIPEQIELTKEQLDAALRNEQIEQAASERDEKRKRRVKEALTSMQRRFDAAYNAIQAEMDEAVETNKWNKKERQGAIALLACLAVLFIAGVFWPSALAVVGLMGYSYRSFELRNQDARQASDNVCARLDDLEDGIRRCALAVQHDLEADAEWEASMKEEQRIWEERQKELLVKRGKTLQSLNTRRKRIVEQIRNQAAHMPHLPDHLPDVAQKARSLLDKKNFGYRPNRSRTHSHSRIGGSDGGATEFDAGATPAWVKYVQTNLPLERLDHESEEEAQFSGVLRQKTDGKWDAVPGDLQLMVLRGYADKKDRVKESLEAIKYILEWRAHCNADDMLKTADDQAKTFFHAWGSRFGGEDRYGHLFVYDRVEQLDLKTLFTMTDDDVLRMRTKQMEVLRQLKKMTSDRLGARVCKHIYVLDLAGLSLGKHFTNRVKNLLGHIFKAIWKILSPTIDSVTKSKIRMVGGKDKYLPEMEKCGIPRSSVPKELGGEGPSTNFFDALLEMIEEGENHSIMGDRSSAAEQPSAIEVVPDESGL